MRLSAAAFAIFFAVGTEPVKDIRETPGCLVRAAPASSPSPKTTLKTPLGIPASIVRSAKKDAESGVHSAGLRMTVSPAASAGPIFHVASIKGAFHGVMSAATPDGSHETLLE